jgi:hypothetical protein
MMQRVKYTSEERARILANPNVNKCGNSSVTFSGRFKLEAIKEYEEGKGPKRIFEDRGLTLELLKKHNTFFVGSIADWKRIHKKKGDTGLLEERRGGKGTVKGKRFKLSNLNDREKLKYLEAQVEYLTAENLFLARLRAKK